LVLDLYAEFRCLTSGLPVPCGYGLLGALAYYGCEGLAAAGKDDMRQLAMRGGPYTRGEQHALLAYCQTDVDALTTLLPRMLPDIDLPRALLRGRYMAAAARMEWTGVPIDVDTLAQLRRHWQVIKTRVVRALNQTCPVYVPTGQPHLDPTSTLGYAISRKAIAHGLDPDALGLAVHQVWRKAVHLYGELKRAVRTARQRTGLTTRRIHLWEDAGRDASTWAGLDDLASELAWEYPALGLGRGDGDYAADLWALLRDGDERMPQK